MDHNVLILRWDVSSTPPESDQRLNCRAEGPKGRVLLFQNDYVVRKLIGATPNNGARSWF